MKHSIKILLTWALLPAVATFSSCKKYFDARNNSTISQDAVFESIAYSESAVTGIYAMLIGDNGYGNRISTLYPMAADDFETSGSFSPLDRRGISMYGPAPSNTELLNPFLQLYKGIERANICIKYIPTSSLYTGGTETQRATMQRLYGEALTLRAQFYHELIRNWGDVPFHKVPASDLEDPYLPKEDRDVIYDQLIDDLGVAADMVPWRSKSTGGFRVTKGFVKGLRARIALARGGYSLRRAESKYGQVMARPADYLKYYQIARDECYDIMQMRSEHTLNPVYENIFRSIHGTRFDNANEIIMEVGAFGGNASTDSKLGYYNGLRHNASSRFGQGGGGVLGIPTYFYEFDSVDTRRDVTLNCFEIDANSQVSLNLLDNMTDGKYRRSWTSVGGTSQNLSINWILLRFSDVLLMFAEAENELKGGPSADAIAAYEEVRGRAYAGNLAKMGSTPTDRQGFFNAIVQERLLEFGGEGIRKYDLIRWNLLATTITETRTKMRELMNRTGRYANVPAVIYFKPVSYDPALPSATQVNNMDFAGGRKANQVFYEPQTITSTPAGYTARNWATSISEADITGASSGFAIFFVPNSRELLPLHVDILTTNYKLKQDYGY